ncbi:MAG: HDOD domain-containing protein [Gammaproteobacteria bacterium]
MTPELKTKLENVTNLPSPPAVAAQVIDLAQQPEVQLAQVAHAISCDASLAAKVMRVANSAMYARRRSSTNLRQALVVLGLNATVTLALGFSLMPILQYGRDQQEMLAHCWRRTLMAAICAREIANITRKANAEEAFLSSLLQDVGIMGLNTLDADFYNDATEFFTDHEALVKFEQEAIGCDHSAVGTWLLRHWGLPEYLQDAVAVSHQLKAASDSSGAQYLSQCVGLAGPLADLWLQGAKNPTEVSRVSRMARNAISISADEYSQLMKNIGTTVPEMAHIFETELIEADEASKITERANEIMTARSLQHLQEASAATEKAERLQSYATDLEEESQRDSLTQVASRSYLMQLLQRGYEHATRFSWPLAIMFIDLDHFKQVNDTYGHPAGDTVLTNVGQLLRDAVRCSDTVGRYGGEEFLVILPGADSEGIKIIAERILKVLRTHLHAVSPDKTIAVTASIGCAHVGEGREYASLDAFVACADEALYAAKHAGRDQYTLYEALPSATSNNESVTILEGVSA